MLKVIDLNSVKKLLKNDVVILIPMKSEIESF